MAYRWQEEIAIVIMMYDKYDEPGNSSILRIFSVSNMMPRL